MLRPFPWFSPVGNAGELYYDGDLLIARGTGKSGIHTNHLVDDLSLKGDFAERRLKLILNKEAYPYTISSLIVGVATLSEALASKRRNWVDCNGTPFEYKPKKFREIIYRRVREVSELGNGKKLLHLYGTSDTYLLPLNRPVPTHVGVIVFPWGKMLFELNNGKRKRIKV